MMKTSKVGYAKIGLGIVLILFLSVYAWLHVSFPVYNERQVTDTIERNMPIGTSQVQVINFLDTLKNQDVYYEGTNTSTDVAVFFPRTMLVMRRWHCVLAQLTFKNGKLTDYEVRRISI